MQALIIHGRQPVLGRAELESLYGPDKLRPVGKIASLLDVNPKEIDFSRLGGMVKFCKVLSILDTTNWEEIQNYLETTVPGHLNYLTEGKLRLGLSTYVLKVSPSRLKATGLELKKIIRNTGRSVRYVPNKENALNSAQVLHNQLTQKLGWELVFVRDGNKTILAQSIAVQDIEKYAARDQVRPYRDSKVGMLPPKLAQIIINLATDGKTPKKEMNLLDPFCGSGVLVQEAALMGFSAHGADIDVKIGEYFLGNMEWLLKNFEVSGSWQLADATKAVWTTSKFEADRSAGRIPLKINVVASETYLGRPFSSAPDKQTLQKVINDCDTIHTKFLQNLKKQTPAGFRLCLAVPAWKINWGFEHLPTLDKLSELGYNRLSFIHASNAELVYHRPGQIVARELVVLERK